MSEFIYIKSIQERMAKGVPKGKVDEQIVRRLWWAALETLQEDILKSMKLSKGLWLASPLPALYEKSLLEKLDGWVWAPNQLEVLQETQNCLLPASKVTSINNLERPNFVSYQRFPLLAKDGNDPLLIIITPEVQIALALQGEPGERSLIIRSDQDTFSDLLNMLDIRLNHEDNDKSFELRSVLSSLGELKTNNYIETSFWPLLSARLAQSQPILELLSMKDESLIEKKESQSMGEISLLEALSHEVRTPLATIRTLIRSLLRRTDLADTVISRLQHIDSECTEQIDRFGLIFNAAELQRNQSDKCQLARTDLGRMLEILHKGWADQLKRRGVDLKIDISEDLPEVLSDPERLELMLGGLIDRTSRGLSSGGTLSMELRHAGPRLKLQIFSEANHFEDSFFNYKENNSDLGPVLSWNPSTGNLQLSQAATQRLLASLGGRLANRRDSALTVFFPISESKY